MRVLVIEDSGQAADAAAENLESAGMSVVRCSEPDHASFPCSGMPGQGGCPIEHGPVDVALSVRAQGGDVTVNEDGVRCALRHHIPVVAAGASDGAPWLPMATVVESDTADVVGAVREAADAPLRRHTETATQQLRDLLERKDQPSEGATAEVHRVVGGLRVELTLGPDVPTPVAQAAAVRVAPPSPARLRRESIHVAIPSTGISTSQPGRSNWIGPATSAASVCHPVITAHPRSGPR